MDDPRFMRGSRASAIWLAIDSDSSIGSGPLARRSASLGPSTSSISRAFHSVSLFKAVDDRDTGMVQRRKDLCFSLEPGEALWISRERVRDHLQSIVPFERRVVRSPDPAHATPPRRAVTS